MVSTEFSVSENDLIASAPDRGTLAVAIASNELMLSWINSVTLFDSNSNFHQRPDACPDQVSLLETLRELSSIPLNTNVMEFPPNTNLEVSWHRTINKIGRLVTLIYQNDAQLNEQNLITSLFTFTAQPNYK